MSERPVVTVDLDGVICRPPFGYNAGIHRGFLDAQAPPPQAFVPPRWLSAPLDRLRFDFRRPLPEALAALAALAERRRVVVLTGRRTSPAGWLRRHGLEPFVDRVVVNDTALSSPHFKLRWTAELAASEHVDDDGRTVQFLAQRSPVRVFLRDWPRNRGLPYADGVTRVADLLQFARLLTEQPGGQQPGGQQPEEQQPGDEPEAGRGPGEESG